MIRSPSQCPGTARSAASAGRWLIITSSVMKPLPRSPTRARGTRSARPVRRHAVSSRRQRAAALHVQRLVDRLVRDTHARHHRGSPAPAGPRSAPGSTRSPTGGPDDAACRARSTAPGDGSGTALAVGPPHLSGQALLHVLAQPVVDRELGGLRALGALLGMPLRHRRPVVQRAAARRGVAAQLPRDRRRRAPDLARDLTHAHRPAARKQRDLLALGEAQVPRRRRVPGRPSASRHPHETTGRRPALTPRRPRPPQGLCQPTRDRLPEPTAVIHPPDRRPSWRPHPRPPRLLPRPSTFAPIAASSH